jgi:hypothetical protein
MSAKGQCKVLTSPKVVISVCPVRRRMMAVRVFKKR